MVTTLAGGILLYSRTRRLARFPTLLSLVCAGSNLTKVGFTRLHHPKVLVSYTHVLDVRKGLVPEPLSEIKKWKSDVEALGLASPKGPRHPHRGGLSALSPERCSRTRVHLTTAGACTRRTRQFHKLISHADRQQELINLLVTGNCLWLIIYYYIYK